MADTLTLPLFHQPTDYHAAGLCGLAAALDSLAPEWGGPVPWRIEPDRLEIDPDPAVIRRVARETLGLDGAGVMAVRPWRDRPRAVRAILQNGLLSTIYQHSKVRRWAGEPATLPPEPLGVRPGAPIPLEATRQTAEAEIAVPYRPLASYLPQRLAEDWTAGRRRLRFASLLPNYPATAATEVQDRDWVLPLYFLVAGSFALPGKRSLHLVPQITDLTRAGATLRALFPAGLRDCYPGGPEDAALAAMLRCRGAGVDPPPIEVWTSKEKDRHNRGICGHATVAPRAEALDRFAQIAAALPVRLGRRQDGRWFLSPGVCRPLFAANLAAGRVWYEGFGRLEWDDVTWESAGLRRLIGGGGGTPA